jgi:hypothetical protein
MSDYWKLNIKDYTLHEIHNLFGLKEPHTTKDIVDADLDLTERIKTDGSIDNDKKKQILAFLSKAKEKLLGEQKFKMAKLVKTRVRSDGSEHMVQNFPNERPHLHNKYVPGYAAVVNHKGVPMPIYKKVLAINSKFRDDYYGTLSTDFLLNLPTKVSQVMSLELTGLEFPNTYFQISKSLGNNFFWLGWQKGTALILNWYYIGIPDGTYRRGEMQTAINEQIQKATGESADKCPQCSIDTTSFRTVFALPISTTNPAAFLQLAFNRTRGGFTVTDISKNDVFEPAPIDSGESNIAQNFGWILGFRMAEYKASTAYVSEGVYDAWGTKYIYVIINDFNKNFSNLIEPVYNSSLGRDNILARVSLAPLLSTISNGTSLADQFSRGDSIRNYFGPVDIEKMRITVTDEFGRVINLNNMDLSLAITCTCLYS